MVNRCKNCGWPNAIGSENCVKCNAPLIYAIINNAIRNHESQLLVPAGTTQDDVYQCIRDIMRENPEIFWFSHQWKYTEEDHTICFQYSISKERSLIAKKQIDDVVQYDFQINNVYGLSVPERIMYVYKWIALYCKPNIYSAYNQSIYSVFVYRNSVCTGYAKAAQYLFKVLGIESKLVFGTIYNVEDENRHCWLIVRINNQWYHFDPTFADPNTCNLLYKAGINPIMGAEGLVYNYFCCDTECIKHSRSIENESELPVCNSKMDYKTLQYLPVLLSREGKGCMLSNAGSCANVYLWHSKDSIPNDNIQKVVKIYKNDKSHDLLEHESRIMRELLPFSSVIHICGVTDQQDGIIMEQATPLADLLCSHYYKLSAAGFCNLLLDVLKGLQDCKDQGIYYRDIHLNNIYRTSEGRYVLGDFGSCVYIGEKRPMNHGGVSSPWYSAPETYHDGVFNESSSTYEVGMLAYFLLNGLLPPLWNEYREGSLKQRIQGCTLPPPALLKNPSCALEYCLLSVINKSLSFESMQRFQRLSDLEYAIRECLYIAKNNDYVLIDGGTSERLDKFDRKINIGENGFNQHTDFHQTCIMPSPPHDSHDFIVNPWQNINDFSVTAECPIRTISQKENKSTTYQPKYDHVRLPVDSKKTFWSKLFGTDAKKRPEDEVYSSVFAPAEVKPKSHLLVQVYLHLLEEAEKIAHLAVESDKNAERRDYIPLRCRLRKGDKVEVHMNIYGEMLLMSEKKSVEWQGSFIKHSFDYLVPNDINVDGLSCLIVLSVNGAQVGEMRFITQIVERPRNLHPKVFSRQYKKIFISYAHQDESKVKYIAHAYDAQGVDHFFDRHYLKPGDIFPLKIKEYIDSADLFVLCWSVNAAQSDYVNLERKQALRRAYPSVKPFEEAPLAIYPMSIEPRAELPLDMKDIYHFDWI